MSTLTKTSTKALTSAHVDLISKCRRNEASGRGPSFQELMEIKLAKVYGLPIEGGCYRVVQDPACAVNPKLSQRLLLQWYPKE